MINSTDVVIATMPSRGTLFNVLSNVISQEEVNSIHIILNSFTEEHINIVKNYYKEHNNISIYSRENKKGSLERFYPIESCDSEYVAIIDDDIIYPADYLKNMINNCNKLNAVVSMHGRVYGIEKLNNYYSGVKELYHFASKVDTIKKVDIVGVGCCLFKRSLFSTKKLNNFYKETSYSNMSDLCFSHFLNKNSIEKYVLPHIKSYLKPIKTNGFSVCEAYKDNCPVQTKFFNEVFLKSK